MYSSPAETFLQRLRRLYTPCIPALLEELSHVLWMESEDKTHPHAEITSIFPSIASQSYLKGVKQESSFSFSPLRVGVVFSGGPAAGGHNVIAGIYDALTQLNSKSLLWGFLNGPEGILTGSSKQLDAQTIDLYRNLGGFDLLGSGRVKIELKEQLDQALTQVSKLQLDGLIVIGGDDSNTNAAILAEYFACQGCLTKVIGVPKTIDGDLRNSHVEISFGFDTACKTYAEMIGNIEKDALSARKYYHFIKIMGRSASHIALECALLTQPNLVFIAEEVADLKRSLSDLITEIADLVSERAELGKHFGVIVIPEGIVECIPEVALLINELNALLVDQPSLTADAVLKQLTAASLDVFLLFPQEIKQQLLLNRDPHGNVQVSSIETEKLFLELVKQELNVREKKGHKKIPFAAVQHFLGYEGRSAFPSNFDCNYCNALGAVAALLIAHGKTGYMACVKNLILSPQEWEIGAVPLCHLMQMELRKGKNKPVITKSLVAKEDKAFIYFQQHRPFYRLEDHYINPGPIQFFGDSAVTDTIPLTVLLNADIVI